MFPKFDFVWHSPAECFWVDYPSSTILKPRDRESGKLGKPPTWPKPEMSELPLISIEQKLDFLQRKQAYDEKMDACRAHVTLRSKNYESLDVDVPLLTTLADLAPMFCKARDIDNKVEDQLSVYVPCEVPYGKRGRTRSRGVHCMSYLFCFSTAEYIAFAINCTKLDLEFNSAKLAAVL
jgi:hypothetical protein